MSQNFFGQIGLLITEVINWLFLDNTIEDKPLLFAYVWANNSAKTLKMPEHS